ncbi:MAG: hypothetical protein AB1558_09470 [Thermodesulfobacteriota bacterium]
MGMRLIAAGFLLLLAAGCAGERQQLQMRDMSVAPVGPGKETKPEIVMKKVELPPGTVFGGASREQAGALAQIFVTSHNMAMQQFDKITEMQESAQKTVREGQEALKKPLQNLEESNQKILGMAQQHQQTAQKALHVLEQLSQKQGSGEITLFYPTGQSKLDEKSFEFWRLVRFIDSIARESRGRKVLLVSIGSASATGKKSWNLKLARDRAEYPKMVIDKYMINIPHEYYKVYGTGDMYSPKGVSRMERERYQHTRLIAVFETDQVPSLPQEQPVK